MFLVSTTILTRGGLKAPFPMEFEDIIQARVSTTILTRGGLKEKQILECDR
ncbi:MAG: hypothetical protein ACKPA7_00710 [Sphaerospermopsis kisseleviana]